MPNFLTENYKTKLEIDNLVFSKSVDTFLNDNSKKITYFYYKKLYILKKKLNNNNIIYLFFYI